MNVAKSSQCLHNEPPEAVDELEAHVTKLNAKQVRDESTFDKPLQVVVYDDDSVPF